MKIHLLASVFLLSVLAIRSEAQSVSFIYEKPLPEHVPALATDTLTICILGDIMMHTEQIRHADKGNGRFDFSSYFSLIGKRISEADIAIANMEFTLAGEPYSGYPTFSAPDSYAEYLAKCGFDIFLCANNHIFDKKSMGAARTLGMFRNLKKRYGIGICGLYMNQEDKDKSCPLQIRRKGFTISLINCTYGTNLGADLHWPKTTYMNERRLISSAIENASGSDLTIVLPHWGTEYSLTHSESQHHYAKWLAENGADIIIGSHPHVAQDYGTVNVTTPDGEYKQIPVAYSLGNAVSNMSAENTQIGLMMTLRIVRERNGLTKMTAPSFTYIWCSRPGGFGKGYTIIPVTEYIGKRDLWAGKWEYDKMEKTYRKVKAIIGIEE